MYVTSVCSLSCATDFTFVLYSQSGQVVAIKIVALRKIEDGIPNTALREIKALRQIEDSPYVSAMGYFHTLICTIINLHDRREGWA